MSLPPYVDFIFSDLPRQPIIRVTAEMIRGSMSTPPRNQEYVEDTELIHSRVAIRLLIEAAVGVLGKPSNFVPNLSENAVPPSSAPSLLYQLYQRNEKTCLSQCEAKLLSPDSYAVVLPTDSRCATNVSGDCTSRENRIISASSMPQQGPRKCYWDMTLREYNFLNAECAADQPVKERWPSAAPTTFRLVIDAPIYLLTTNVAVDDPAGTSSSSPGISIDYLFCAAHRVTFADLRALLKRTSSSTSTFDVKEWSLKVVEKSSNTGTSAKEGIIVDGADEATFTLADAITKGSSCRLWKGRPMLVSVCDVDKEPGAAGTDPIKLLLPASGGGLAHVLDDDVPLVRHLQVALIVTGHVTKGNTPPPPPSAKSKAIPEIASSSSAMLRSPLYTSTNMHNVGSAAPTSRSQSQMQSKLTKKVVADLWSKLDVGPLDQVPRTKCTAVDTNVNSENELKPHHRYPKSNDLRGEDLVSKTSLASLRHQQITHQRKGQLQQEVQTEVPCRREPLTRTSALPYYPVEIPSLATSRAPSTQRSQSTIFEFDEPSLAPVHRSGDPTQPEKLTFQPPAPAIRDL